MLGASGFTGIPDVLEAGFGGFLSTMGGGVVDLGALTAGLGTIWETDAVGSSPLRRVRRRSRASRWHASCAPRCSARAARPGRSVTIHSSTHAAVHCGWAYEPAGVTAAQMSIPYGVACMLLHGDVSADRFSLEAISEPAVVRLAGRVTVVGDDAIDALGPEHRYQVRVRAADRDDVRGAHRRGVRPARVARRRRSPSTLSSPSSCT